MIGQTISCWKTTAALRRSLVLGVALVGILSAAEAKLDGRWLFESQTEDGVLRAALSFATEESTLKVELNIDRHRLTGNAMLTGNEFEVVLGHAEQPGSPGHDSRLHLRGGLVGEHIRGTWDDGEHQGEWTATRE